MFVKEGKSYRIFALTSVGTASSNKDRATFSGAKYERWLENVALSLFDDAVPTEVKANVAQVMLEADKD